MGMLQFWRRKLYQHYRRKTRSTPRNGTQQTFRIPKGPLYTLFTFLAAALLAASVIGLLESRLRPVVNTIASTQAQNKFLSVIEGAIYDDLAIRGIGYSDFILIERNKDGAITALTTNMASMNRLRAELVDHILISLEKVDITTIRVPIGMIADLDMAWARGPSIQVRSCSVGTVSAEFSSEFTSAGINQTLHRIYLKIDVPLTLMLPGGAVKTSVETSLCVAETVIVGSVPDAYLNLDGNLN